MQNKALPLLKRILLCSFLFFVLHSCKSSTCSKTISCPGYSSPLADTWFPYHDQQQLIFKSSTGIYDTLHLQLEDSTAAYTSTSGGFSPSIGCGASKSLQSVEHDSLNENKFGIQFRIFTTGVSVNIYTGAPSYFGGELVDSGFAYYNVSNVHYYINNKAPQTLHNYSIGGNTYALAQVFVNDTAIANNAIGTYKMIVAKNAGIVEYETNPGNIVWIKQ